MAAELGELVLAIDAENLRLKKKLKSSEQLTKKSADIMAKSLDKVSSSGEGTSATMNILEKAAAATGLTWLTQVKSLAELALGLGKARTLVTASTAAYRTESVAVGQNTAALAANAAARAAIPGAAAVGGAAGGQAVGNLAKVGGYGAGGGILATLLSAPVALSAFVAGIVAVNANLYGLRDILGEWGGGIVNRIRGVSGKIEKAEAEMDARFAEATARISAREKVSAVRRTIEAKTQGLTGGAYVSATADPRTDPRLVRVQAELADLTEKIRQATEGKARAAAEAAQQVAKEKADQIRITAERKQQAALTKQQNIAAKASRIMGGMGSPAEMAAHVERLVRETGRQITYAAEITKRLTTLGAEKTLARLGLSPQIVGEKAAGAGGRAMLASGRGLAGMPVPSLGRGGAGGIGGQSIETKKVKAQERTAKNTGQMLDIMRQGSGMGA